LAESQILLGQFQDAIDTLKKATPSAASLTLEASCQQGLGDVDRARELLRDALKLDPLYSLAKLVQGKLCMDSGDPEQAVSILKEVTQLEPQNSKARMQLSQALRELNRTAEADAELKRMLEIQALEREFTDLHDAAAKQPENAQVRLRLGEVAFQLNRQELARMWFKAALGIDETLSKAKASLQDLDRSRNGAAAGRAGTVPSQ
jgi:Flp pilus assembly protein TadD